MPQMKNNVLSWASDIEPKTLEQAEMAASLPFIDGHLALMPDAHIGSGATIGSVIPTKGAIIPSAVGVDIGCGMIATELPITSAQLPDNLDALLARIANVVPAGVGKGHDGVDLGHLQLRAKALGLSSKQEKKASQQMGSLGSGNHFIEVCLDERDAVWIVLHSGSRGIGNELARDHIESAKGLMKSYFIELPDPDLAYLVEGTYEFDAYIAAMRWAQDYALANREVMMTAVLKEVEGFLSRWVNPVSKVNCHHNFTEREHHNGHNVWLTRKGAIRAREGDVGVIPGSMGTQSYIVEGLGNRASYHSCSHGAGRKMSRSKARKTLSVESFREAMGDRTWLASQAEDLLDEHPNSYKDIDGVMADQTDLVSIRHRLHQVLNYKGL